MFIEVIMKDILYPVSEKYISDYNRATNMSPQDIYDELLSNINYIDTADTPMHGTVVFVTPGCPHNVNDGNHCGCSFCDWNDSYVANPAFALALREKDIYLYKKMQYEAFSQIREVNQKPKTMEEIAIHDCFDSKQITIDEIETLFKKDVFSDKPAMGLLQVRAENVAINKIQKWKSFFKKVLTLGIGVETGNEWLRNHWLNKNLTNMSLQEAIDAAHKAGCYISANILITLPGLSFKQNLHQFLDSLFYLDKIGFDSIMISPLVNKKYTIQNHFFKLSKSNDDSRLYEVTESLYELSKLDDRLQNKIMLSILNFDDFFNQIIVSDDLWPLVEDIRKMLTIGGMKEIKSLAETINRYRNKNNYRNFLENRPQQCEWKNIKEHLIEQANILCEVVSPDNREKVLFMFLNEVEEWK